MGVQQRFLLLSDVAEILNISSSQTYALVRSGDLPALKVGGRGQWRVEQAVLEEWIEQAYDATRRFVRDNPYPGRVGGGAAADDEAVERAAPSAD